MKKAFALTVLSLISGSTLFAQDEPSYTLNGYRPNNLTFNILTATDHGVGGGITFDRFLDKKGIVELSLPFSLISDSYQHDGYYNSPNKGRFYFMPGLKFYPRGIKRNAFALGPSLVYSYYKGMDHYNGGGSFTNHQFGIIMKAYYQMNITPRFNFNVNGGLGLLYLNNFNYEFPTNYNYHESVAGLVNINIGFGVRL